MAWNALQRARLPHLTERYNPTVVIGLFTFINCCVSIAIMSTIAFLSGEPFIFPSLGPTAFLFFYTPMTAVSSPRNTILGHLAGIVAGWGSLAIFGLTDAAPAITIGVSDARIGAAALSLGATSVLMIVLKAAHPPAGATTLIISLGILRSLEQLLILMLAVALLTLQSIVINRLAGIPYPLWAARQTALENTERQIGQSGK